MPPPEMSGDVSCMGTRAYIRARVNMCTNVCCMDSGIRGLVSSGATNLRERIIKYWQRMGTKDPDTFQHKGCREKARNREDCASQKAACTKEGSLTSKLARVSPKGLQKAAGDLTSYYLWRLPCCNDCCWWRCSLSRLRGDAKGFCAAVHARGGETHHACVRMHTKLVLLHIQVVVHHPATGKCRLWSTTLPLLCPPQSHTPALSLCCHMQVVVYHPATVMPSTVQEQLTNMTSTYCIRSAGVCACARVCACVRVRASKAFYQRWTTSPQKHLFPKYSLHRVP
eukprot:1151392-Pelagomonas_calceolata.AAC.7